MPPNSAGDGERISAGNISSAAENLPEEKPSKYFSDALCFRVGGSAEANAIFAARFAHSGASASICGINFLAASSTEVGSGGGK